MHPEVFGGASQSDERGGADAVLDCGGKRSATPLSRVSATTQSAVAAALCRRSPYPTKMRTEERSQFESFLKRGGGLVVLHDGICGTNTSWFASMAGDAKQHGEKNWKQRQTKLHFEDHTHPLVQGAADFEMDDEMFFRQRTAPEMKVLAAATPVADEAVPQLWVYEKALPEGRPHRAFVSLQGHNYSCFSLPEFRRLLLRGIA